MPLIGISRAAQVRPNGLEVTATSSQGASIRVLVTQGAINTMAPGSEPYMKRLEDNLTRFREIASAKYDAGEIEADGHVIIQAEDPLEWATD